MENSEVVKWLMSQQDIKYREFHSSLIPNLSKGRMIGVRTPILKKYAKQMIREDRAGDFIQSLPHDWYEENNLHAYILNEYRDYKTLVCELERFLPYIDNWATCDAISPKIFRAHTEDLYEHIKQWIVSEEPYTIRLAIDLLHHFYMGEAFDPAQLALVAQVQSEHYYVNMMIAWYFATALTKQYETTLPWIVEGRLSRWVHNKTIQKARESLAIPKERKEYLKTLRKTERA